MHGEMTENYNLGYWQKHGRLQEITKKFLWLSVSYMGKRTLELPILPGVQEESHDLTS